MMVVINVFGNPDQKRCMATSIDGYLEKWWFDKLELKETAIDLSKEVLQIDKHIKIPYDSINTIFADIGISILHKYETSKFDQKTVRFSVINPRHQPDQHVVRDSGILREHLVERQKSQVYLQFIRVATINPKFPLQTEWLDYLCGVLRIKIKDKSQYQDYNSFEKDSKNLMNTLLKFLG
jgi:hypothetical protein